MLLSAAQSRLIVAPLARSPALRTVLPLSDVIVVTCAGHAAACAPMASASSPAVVVVQMSVFFCMFIPPLLVGSRGAAAVTRKPLLRECPPLLRQLIEGASARSGELEV